MHLGDFFKGSGSGLISGAFNLAGGALSSITGKQSSDREYERQKEFAQNGIRWKVADAKAAGIHPIFAIGSNTPSYSPQAAVGSDYGLSQMGQNISRAIEAKQTPEERAIADLQREGLKLDNDYKRAQIEKVRSDTLWDEMDYISRQYRLSEMMANAGQTQRPPALPRTDKQDPNATTMYYKDQKGRLISRMPGAGYLQSWGDWLNMVPVLGALASQGIDMLFGSPNAEGKIWSWKRGYIDPPSGYHPWWDSRRPNLPSKFLERH